MNGWVLGGIGILLAAVTAFVVQWIRKANRNSVSLAERDSALQVESEHVAAQHKAAAKNRANARKDFEDEKRAATDAVSAAELLQKQFRRPRGS